MIAQETRVFKAYRHWGPFLAERVKAIPGREIFRDCLSLANSTKLRINPLTCETAIIANCG
jgi:hypothetical protein